MTFLADIINKKSLEEYWKKVSPKTALFLVLGIVIGVIIAHATTVSVRELKTPAFTMMGDDKTVEFANSLGLVSFQGAWVVVSGEEMVNNINSVEIDCWLERKTCYVAQANVVDGDFYNGLDYYDITEWSNTGQITAISTTVCEDQILKADIKTKVVTLTEAGKDNADSEFCVQALVPTVLKLSSRGYGKQ